jgi:hypothetical protein
MFSFYRIAPLYFADGLLSTMMAAITGALVGLVLGFHHT